MEVILLEKIHHLGNLGEIVDVKPGFGRNYLIPEGKAVPANDENKAKFEAKRAELEKTAEEKLAKAQKRAETLNSLTVTITCQASDEGKLYGSIGTQEIANAINAAGANAEKHEVLLPDGTIRQLGEYKIALQLHSDVTATITLVLNNEK